MFPSRCADAAAAHSGAAGSSGRQGAAGPFRYLCATLLLSEAVRTSLGCSDLRATNTGASGLCNYDCSALGDAYFPVSGATRCFVFGNEEWPTEMLAMRTLPEFTPAQNATCDGIFSNGTAAAIVDCGGRNGTFVAAVGTWCGDGILTDAYWAQRQRLALQVDVANFSADDCRTLTIDIPIQESWIVQGRYTAGGELALLDVRFSSGNLSVSSNANVVLRYLRVVGKTSVHTGGAFDYHGGDGAVLIFEHV
jgi:hypothetical protein